jgi:hypothetical protein
MSQGGYYMNLSRNSRLEEMGKISPHDLHQRWVHSHEEDTADEMVFRPESFPFPRSRGRSGFELKPDQSMVEIGIAPADGPLINHGRWSLDADGRLLFYDKSSSKPVRNMKITSASNDRLTIKK